MAFSKVAEHISPTTLQNTIADRAMKHWVVYSFYFQKHCILKSHVCVSHTEIAKQDVAQIYSPIPVL